MEGFWSSDVRISLPEALPDELDAVIPMYGFTMTENGLFHDLSTADRAVLAIPTFSPESGVNTVVWGDEDQEDDIKILEVF